MKVQGWVMTDRVGSKMKFDVEIDDETLREMDQSERVAHIDAEVHDAMMQRVEWGWSPIT